MGTALRWVVVCHTPYIHANLHRPCPMYLFCTGPAPETNQCCPLGLQEGRYMAALEAGNERAATAELLAFTASVAWQVRSRPRQSKDLRARWDICCLPRSCRHAGVKCWRDAASASH